MLKDLTKTNRSSVKRSSKRALYDRKAAYDLLDSQPQCSVGYVFDGSPYVTPTLQWRSNNRVIWHGSSASKALRHGANTEVCLTVSILDGFVMARSGFNHSVNARSLVLFGQATLLDDAEKEKELERFMNHLWPGRLDFLRPITQQELKATMLLAIEIDEGSMKIRAEPPDDDDYDTSLSIWAGVIPIKTVLGTPESDPKNIPGVQIPDHIRNFQWPDNRKS